MSSKSGLAVACALDEEAHRLDPAERVDLRRLCRVGKLERRHRVDPLLREVERRAARDEQRQARSGPEQLA